MEENGVLNPSHQIDLYCLHHTYAMRIDGDLEKWKNAHNNHSVSTEHFKTPNQLWISGNLQNQDSDNVAMNNIFRRDFVNIESKMQLFLDENLIGPNDISVFLPRPEPPLTNFKLNELKLSINVMRDSVSHGIDIYGEVKKFVYGCIRT